MKRTWFKRILSWSLAAAMLIGEPALALADDSIVTADENVTLVSAASDKNLKAESQDEFTQDLADTTGVVSIHNAAPADEARLLVNASTVTVEAGEEITVPIQAQGVDGNYNFKVSDLNDSSEIGFTDSSDSSNQTLSIIGTEQGSNLCTLTMEDSTTGAIVASKTIMVKTTAASVNNAGASISASANTLYVLVGKTAKLNFRVKGYSGKQPTAYCSNDNSIYKSSFGAWDGYLKTMNITGKKVGSASFTFYAYNGSKEIARKTVTIKVVPRNTIVSSWSSKSIIRTKYKDVTLKYYGRSSGAKISAKVSNKKKVRIAWQKKSSTGSTLRIRGLQRGSTYITFALKKNGKTLGSKKIKVTVKNTGVIDFAWRFTNSADGLGISDPYNYVYPYKVFSRMYGNNALARRLWNIYGHGEWGGDCYGMATVAGMSYMQNLAGTFKSGAIRHYDLSIGSKSSYSGMTVKSFIQSMMWSQLSTVEQNRNNTRYSNSTSTYTNIVNQTKKGTLVAIGFRTWLGWGHEVLAYKCVVSGNTAKVYYYDPNYSDTPYYITFYKSGSSYTSCTWSNSDYNYYYDGRMTYTTYSEYNSMWKNRGHLSSYAANMVSSSSKNFKVLNAKGKTVAVVKDGKLTKAASGITQVDTFSQNVVSETVLYVPTGTYTIRNTDTKTGSFTVSMTNVDHSAEVKTTGSIVNFKVADNTGDNLVSISRAKGTTYAIRLESSAANEPTVLAFAGTGTTSKVVAGTKSGSVTKGTNATAVAAD